MKKVSLALLTLAVVLISSCSSTNECENGKNCACDSTKVDSTLVKVDSIKVDTTAVDTTK